MGLSCLGILKEIEENPRKMESLFVHQDTKLDAAQMDFLFNPSFTGEEGSNRYRAELTIHAPWRDLLQVFEGKHQ